VPSLSAVTQCHRSLLLDPSSVQVFHNICTRVNLEEALPLSLSEATRDLLLGLLDRVPEARYGNQDPHSQQRAAPGGGQKMDRRESRLISQTGGVLGDPHDLLQHQYFAGEQQCGLQTVPTLDCNQYLHWTVISAKSGMQSVPTLECNQYLDWNVISAKSGM
jgi:hypothetical protein